MTPSLFDLTGEALALQRQINDAAELLFSDDPTESDAARATLEALISAEADNRKAVETKADAWCWVIDHIRAQAAARAAHAQRLKDLATAAEQQADVLQDRLICVLQKVDPDSTKWDLPAHKITSRKTTKVELDPELNPERLPEDLRRVKYEANKTAIKEKIQAAINKATKDLSEKEAAIKAAQIAATAVPGTALVEGRSWSIK